MDNLIFCLNATVPIFAIIVLGRWLRSKNFFTKQTLTDIDRLSFKVLLPILLFRDIAQGRITEQFDPVFFFFCAGATTVYFFAVWIGASLFLKDKSMVGAFTQGAFRGSQAILGVAFVQNLYGNAGLVPLMLVASVPTTAAWSAKRCAASSPTRSYWVFSRVCRSRSWQSTFRRCWTRVCPCWATAQRLWRC